MSHKTILLIILSAASLISLCYIIKNKPDYLVLLGIRGLLSFLIIQFINYLCSAAQLSAVVLANPITLSVGGILGFPGILLLYLTKIYFA